MIAREGNIVKYATFSTEHDNLKRSRYAATPNGEGAFGILDKDKMRRQCTGQSLVSPGQTLSPHIMSS
jgi:hypothetical protein